VQFFFRVMNRLMEHEKGAQAAAGTPRRPASVPPLPAPRGPRKERSSWPRPGAWRGRAQALCVQLDTVEILSAEALVLADKNGLLTSPHPEVCHHP